MNKLLKLITLLFLIGCSPEEIITPYEEVEEIETQLTYIYLDDNGVTIKATEHAEGMKWYELDGTEYLVVHNDGLRNAYQNDIDLSKVVTTFVTSLEGATLFWEDEEFNDNISSWDVSNVTDMKALFYGAISFNQDLSYWDVSKVKNMQYMFHNAKSFTSDLSNWNVSNVESMQNMFKSAHKFNSDLSNWDVSKVTKFNSMFSYAKEFNSDISNWDVSNSTSVAGMFSYTDNFNQDLSSWDLSHLIMTPATPFAEAVRPCGGFDDSTPSWILPKPDLSSCR